MEGDYLFGIREEGHVTIPLFGVVDNVHMRGTAISADATDHSRIRGTHAHSFLQKT